MTLFLALILGSSFSFAKDLGITDVPDQPNSKRATWSKQEFREDFPREISAPLALVPWNFERHGRLSAGRYYDENGNVYTSKQAVEILDNCDDCEDSMDDFHRYNNAATGWAIGNAVSILVFFPAILVCTPVEIVKLKQADREWGAALETYNEGGGATASAGR